MKTPNDTILELMAEASLLRADLSALLTTVARLERENQEMADTIRRCQAACDAALTNGNPDAPAPVGLLRGDDPEPRHPCACCQFRGGIGCPYPDRAADSASWGCGAYQPRTIAHRQAER
jgi:hypothetical protein